MSDAHQNVDNVRSGARFRRDRTGEQHGCLTVLSFACSRKGHIYWTCLCVCGKTREYDGAKLRNAPVRCYCSNAHPKYGHKKQPEYGSWMNTRGRCCDPNNGSWKDYGARGIRFHEPWHDFRNFIRDVGPRPGPGYSLDRIDPTGHYEPGNVRWADRKTQNNNKRLSEPRVREVLERANALFGPGADEVVAYITGRLFGVAYRDARPNALDDALITES